MNWDLIFWNALYTAINAAAAGYCLIPAGLNVHVGYTGLLNFGQAGFAAVGCLRVRRSRSSTYGWPWYWRAAVHARRVRCCSRCSLGIPTLRLRADYLAIVTIAASPRSSGSSSTRRGSPG